MVRTGNVPKGLGIAVELGVMRVWQKIYICRNENFDIILVIEKKV